MNDYPPELALAHVVMRVGGLRSLADIEELKKRIEGERTWAESLVEASEHRLRAVDVMLAESNQETRPDGEA